MAKKTQRRPARCERSRAGCMWGLISMFDFRHGRTSQKLLTDRAHERRIAVGAGLPKNKLDMLTTPDEKDRGTLDKEESKTVAAGTVSIKPSVKKLIEEEMFGDQDVKKRTDHGEREPKRADKVDCQRKNSKRTNRGRSKSFDICFEDQDADKSRSEWPSLRNSKKRSTKSVDMGELMEEFCQQVQQQGICFVSNQHNENEVHDRSNQNNLDFEEKLREAIKLFITQKLISDRKEVGVHQLSKELIDVLQNLISDGELVLKQLQGPKSMLVKFVDSLLNSEVENDIDSKQLTQSNLLEQGIQYKLQKIFGRKGKSLEKSTLKPTLASEPSSRIVILKPGSTPLQSPAIEGCLDSLPKSPFTIRNKGPGERVGSYLFLTELKRKLKNVLRKERIDISAYHISNKSLNDHRVLRDGEKGYKENVGRKSPTKDHFFMERIARPSKAATKGERTKQLQEYGTAMEKQSGKYHKQRLTNLYIEAKKHLSEVLRNEDGGANFPSEHTPKALWRVLSLPESRSSPVGSPGRDCGELTRKQRHSSVDNSLKEGDVSHLGQSTVNGETELCTSDDRSDSRTQINLQTNLNDWNDQGNVLENACCSRGDEISQGGTEIVQATEILVHGEISFSRADSEPISSTTVVDDQDADLSEACDENTHEEIQAPSSPASIPSMSPITKNVEKLEETVYTSERPSPVSVLEPRFSEEDISPASIKYQPAELLVQPVRIQFEDGELSSIGQEIPRKHCEKDNESIYEYLEAVLLASGMRWDDFCIRAHFSDQLLDQSIFDEVDFFFDELCCDKKLLFDCINEILMDVYWKHSGCFRGLLLLKPTIRPIPDTKSVICEVWGGVQWHLLPLPQPHTLDQIVNKDMSKSGRWMDLRSDAETVIFQIGEAIFEDLMEDTMVVLSNISLENGDALIAEELKGSKRILTDILSETVCTSMELSLNIITARTRRGLPAT